MLAVLHKILIDVTLVCIATVRLGTAVYLVYVSISTSAKLKQLTVSRQSNCRILGCRACFLLSPPGHACFASETKSRLDRSSEFVLTGSLGDGDDETTAFGTFGNHGSPVRRAGVVLPPISVEHFPPPAICTYEARREVVTHASTPI